MAVGKRSARLIVDQNASIKELYPGDKVNNWFKEFTGYDLNRLKSLENVIELLHSPRDGSSLAVARIFFGLAMMIDTVEERAGSDLDTRWGDERDCRFVLFPFIHPLSMPRMGILYGIMWLGALGICVGYKFTISCCMYTIAYWYIILLDKSVWNNHSYLFGLMGILFACSSANKCLSLDSYWQGRKHSRDDGAAAAPNDRCVPFWNYFVIKFQYYILYTLAGVYKMSPEWLSGYSMANLGHHWVFTPFRLLLGIAWTDLLIIHWFGCIFDLTVAFWLTHKRTRIVATAFAISFHLMNSRLFTIGMFPWVCLLHLPLFYAVDWPRRLQRMLAKGSGGGGVERENSQTTFSSQEEPAATKKGMDIKSRHRRTTILLVVYMSLQLFLPNSHFITKGYNNWTKGLYGYSWNMMVNSWQPILTSIKIVDNASGKTLYLDPTAFAENNRWSRNADMAKQYAECIHRNLKHSVNEQRDFEISTENISIYFDVWCSMNSRFQQRVFDPRVDILHADWSPWSDTEWVLPLLNELTEQRPQLMEISDHVLGWSNYSDVLFIADYPGLSLDNYIADSAENVSLTVLGGSVRLSYEQDALATPVTLTSGQSISILREAFHNILVVSDTPASYMYTYTNATMSESGQGEEPHAPAKALLPLWEETMERWNKFEMFLQHVLNSLLHEIYGVPMPLTAAPGNN